jgi:hypothetical protein
MANARPLRGFVKTPLTSAAINTNTYAAKSFAYDPVGNLTSRPNQIV